MRAALALAIALFLQIASVSSNEPTPEPQHFRYERALTLPANTTGQACAILDATVFAHAASESLNDLRLYTQTAGNPALETPFNLSVNGTQTAEDDLAPLRNLGSTHGDIVFDLEMPSRPYSAVILDLAAKDFLATAHVSGSDSQGGSATDLGTFAVFDLTSQHLSRSTMLPLQETTFPELHVTLHLSPAPNTPAHDLGPSIVHAATIPPSREAQTLYTAVASTSNFTRRGRQTIASIHIPAHIPVERLSFTLNPTFGKNFFRSVSITAAPDNNRDPIAVESLTGTISHVHLPQNPTGGPTIDTAQQSIDAALGANLRTGATVSIAVDNGDDSPLPLASVQLEMRQRRICFDATNSTYTFMYGDSALHAPVYDYGRFFTPSMHPTLATLTPEYRNPTFTARPDNRPYTERHPEFIWVILLAVLAVFSSIVLRNSRTHKV